MYRPLANVTGIEQNRRNELLKKCYSYLNTNFHKFNDSQKIRIALQICSKDIPQELTGAVSVTLTQQEELKIRENLANAIRDLN